MYSNLGESKMNLKNKKVLLVSMLTLSILTIIGSISYAYFTTMTKTERSEVTMSTANIRVIFSDNNSGIEAVLDFDKSVTKSFILTNDGNTNAVVRINWKDIVNTYTFGSLTYSLEYSEEENGSYTRLIDEKNVPRSKVPETIFLSDKVTIPANKSYYYNLTITLNYLDEVDQTSDLEAKFSSKFSIVDGNSGVIENMIATSRGVKQEKTAENEIGVYEAEDDYGTSYYYRGIVENNYVKFGKWNDDVPDRYIGFWYGTAPAYKEFVSLDECQNDDMYNKNCTLLSTAGKDMYWRVVRINGDGSLRIIYEGTNPQNNDFYSVDDIIGVSPWNNYADDVKYAGYMFGGANGEPSTSKEQAQKNETDSTMKIYLDNWYVKNIVETGYSEFLSDGIFCNDRNTTDTPNSDNFFGINDTGLGYGDNETLFGYYLDVVEERADNILGAIFYSSNPSLKCNKNDAFTVSDIIKGNGKLTYPIGLLTADESDLAGSQVLSENYNYLHGFYYSMSPIGFSYNRMMMGTTGVVGYVAPVGDVGYGVAPVINLSSEYVKTLIGTGTATDPYRMS